MDAALRERIAERARHVLLAYELREGTWPEFTREREIAHGFDVPWGEAARTSRTSAPDIAATAAPFRA